MNQEIEKDSCQHESEIEKDLCQHESGNREGFMPA